MLHEERLRAESFGEDAERYDRVRPSYPSALVEELGAPGLDVLDVGCGTGKAGRLFQDAGCRVLGVEIDERMATVARRGGLPVEIGAFESWPDEGRRFDLVISGQAWHWVDPVRGVAKAGDLLRPGGHLAPFWNTRRPDPPAIRDRFAAVYERYAPEMARGSMALGTAGRAGAGEDYLASLAADGRFGPPRFHRYPWTCRYDAARWRELLGTHSDHHLLPPAQRETLLDAVEQLVVELGGELEVSYETVAVIAERLR